MSQDGAYLYDPAAFWGDEDVQMMSYAEAAMYKRLLDHQWQNGSIPADHGKLARLLCRGPEVFDSQSIATLSPTLLAPFDPVPDDPSRLRQKRMHKTREEWRAKQRGFREAGKKGAEKRWGKKDSRSYSHPNGEALTPPNRGGDAKVRKGKESKETQEEIHISEEGGNGAPKRVNKSATFEQWWQHYPKKVAKKKAKEAWCRMSEPPAAEVVIAFIDQAQKTKRWRDGYVPDGSTFVNQARWEDDLEAYSQRPVGSEAGAEEPARKFDPRNALDHYDWILEDFDSREAEGKPRTWYENRAEALRAEVASG